MAKQKIVSHCLLMLAWLQEAPERVTDQWVDGFTVNAERIGKKVQSRIPDKGRFVSRIAKASSRAYKDSVNPDFISRKGLSQKNIIIKQNANLERSFEKWESGVKQAYKTVDGIPAKPFKDKIAVSRQNFSRGVGMRLLPFTGTKIEGLGAAPLAAGWLVKENGIEDKLRAGDSILEGGPFNVTTRKRRMGLKSLINQRVIQAGAAIARSEFDPPVFEEQNDLSNELVNGFLDPALNLVDFSTGGDSHLDYVMVEGQGMFLDVQVSVV